MEERQEFVSLFPWAKPKKKSPYRKNTRPKKGRGASLFQLAAATLRHHGKMPIGFGRKPAGKIVCHCAVKTGGTFIHTKGQRGRRLIILGASTEEKDRIISFWRKMPEARSVTA